MDALAVVNTLAVYDAMSYDLLVRHSPVLAQRRKAIRVVLLALTGAVDVDGAREVAERANASLPQPRSPARWTAPPERRRVRRTPADRYYQGKDARRLPAGGVKGVVSGGLPTHGKRH